MSKKILKVARFLVISLASIIVIGLLLVSFVLMMMTKHSDRIFSPNKKYFAQVIEVNGGATTSYQTSVMITNASYFFNSSDILSARSGNGKSVFGFNGDLSSVTTSWTDNNTLKITFSNCTKIYSKHPSWNGIKVVFEGECQ